MVLEWLGSLLSSIPGVKITFGDDVDGGVYTINNNTFTFESPPGEMVDVPDEGPKEIAHDPAKLPEDAWEEIQDALKEINTLTFGSLPGETAYVHNEESKEMTLDPAKLPEDAWEEIQAPLKEGWREEGEISLEPTYPIYSSVEKSLNNKEVKEISGYFRDKIPYRHYKILELSLHLNKTIENSNLSKEEVESRKKQIADKYGIEAYSVTNLGSGGYFHEGNIFREMYAKKVENGAWSAEEYEEQFKTIVQEKPFVVFVSSDQSPQDVFDLVCAKLKRLPRYRFDLDFIDIRGMGPINNQTITKALGNLEDEYESIDYKTAINGNEKIVRIDTNSVDDALPRSRAW